MAKSSLRFLKTCTLLALCAPLHSKAELNDDFFEMSLEELKNVIVSTGQLTQVRSQQSLSALTVISQEHISLSSAKNVAELLEIYVPGLMLMAHSEGDKIGLRGNIAAENYKLLLLVNGRDITNMVYEGTLIEIDQWDLSDIARVEVVRGPGSVVYGTGAIAGVINIITKSPDNAGSSINLYHNLDYRSAGFSLQTASTFGDWRAYFFGSYRKTDGLEDPDYYLTANNLDSDVRWVGKRAQDEYGPQAYLADTFDRPQVKLHTEIKYQDSFDIFARYTQSGQLHHFRAQVPRLGDDGQVIGIADNRKVSLRSFIIAPRYTHQLNEKASLTANLSYDSQEYIRYDQANLNWPEEHPNNVKDYAFSQNRLVASLLYAFQGDDWQVTTGYEYRGINVGAPWGEGQEHIMVREGVFMISDFDTSVYTQDLSLRNRPSADRVEEIGSGIDFRTHSHLFEVTRKLTDSTSLHYGHRLDFPDAAANMFSPRLGLVSTHEQLGTFTATLQRAQRTMPLRAQYLIDKYGEASDVEHETIDSLEISYSGGLGQKTLVSARGFYNDIDAVGFTGVNLQFIANLKLAGLELEANYKSEGFELLINHSFLKNIDFTMNEALKTGAYRNNISYADYFHFTRGDFPLTLESYGDGINNWSENTTKLVLTKKLLDGAMLFQLDAQVFWDYTGAYDEMRMYQQAYSNVEQETLNSSELEAFLRQRDEFENERRLIEQEGAYKTEVNLGASLTYRYSLGENKTLEVSLYAQNLLKDRYRYYVNTGSSSHYPNRLNFMKEPRIIGGRVSYRF